MGYWIGDESDPWNPNEESGNQRDNPVAEIGARLGDIPADALNTTTGTGENVGWFGEFDEAADPRSWGPGEEPDWAEPSEATTGISGFFGAATGATGHVVDEASRGAGRSLWQNPKLLGLLVVGGLVALAPYANVLAGVTGE